MKIKYLGKKFYEIKLTVIYHGTTKNNALEDTAIKIGLSLNEVHKEETSRPMEHHEWSEAGRRLEGEKGEQTTPKLNKSQLIKQNEKPRYTITIKIRGKESQKKEGVERGEGKTYRCLCPQEPFKQENGEMTSLKCWRVGEIEQSTEISIPSEISFNIKG